MRPYLEISNFVHSSYDEAEVVDDGRLVLVMYASASSLVVKPQGNKFGGNMVVRIVCHFSDEGYLLCYDLIFDVEYIEEFIHHCFICDALLFHLIHLDAYYESDAAM